MCDPTNFNNVEKWVRDFKRMVGDNVPIVCIINKSELLPIDFRDERFIMISCKTNTNIEEVLNKF